MNLLARNKFKIVNWFLILILVLVFSCDDIFVTDISEYVLQLKTPSAGWQGKDKAISFRWDEVPEADNYQLEVVTPGFSVNHRLVFEKKLKVAKFDTTLLSGDYEWRIKAINSASSTSYSTSTFKILYPSNIALQQVLLKLPEDKSTSKLNDISFRWDAVDGASFYSFKIKKMNWAGDSIVVAKRYSTNFNFRLDDGTYAWGVAAIDTVTNKKTDYTIRSFSVDNNPPSIPKLITPANRDTLKNLIVSLNWRKTEANATYLIEVYSDPDLKNRIIEKLLSDTTTYVSLEKSGYYYWIAKSIDQLGNSSIFSPASAFCIILPTDIQSKSVQLMSPADKSTVIEKKVTFWWNSLGGATKYNLQIVSPSFASPAKLVYDQWITTNSVAIELDAGNYQWRVKAANNISETGFTQASLSIYNNDLTKQKIVLLMPLYAEQITKPMVKISWEKLTGSLNYHLIVKKDSWESGTIVQEMNTGKTEVDLSFLDGEYFWGVKAVDPQNGSETEYSIRKFGVNLKGDLSTTKISLLSPADKSTVIDKKVTFWWNPLVGAEKYNLQIVSPTFANPTKLVYDQWITTNSAPVELDAGNYEWRVKASNTISETGYTQAFLSIYNTDLTKQKTTLVKPLYAEQLNKSSVKFIWEKLNSSASYHLLVKKDSWESGAIVQEMNTDKTEVDLSFFDGEYFWGVKAIDPKNESETIYSTRKFVIDLIVPDAPRLKLPANNLSTTDYLIDFSWEPADATDSKLTYTFEISQIVNNVATLLTTKVTQQKSIGYNMESVGKYKWRVYATDSAGNQSVFSEYRYFEVK